MAVSSKLGKSHDTVGKFRKEPCRPARTGRGCDFLTFRFDGLPAPSIITVTDTYGSIDVLELAEQARRYLRTTGKEFCFRPSGNRCADVLKLYKMLKDGMGGTDDIDLITATGDDNMRHNEFVAYKVFTDFDTTKIFFMPIQIVSFIDDRLKDIMLDFFAYLQLQSPFLSIGESMEMTLCLGLDYFDNDGQKGDSRIDDSEILEHDGMTARYLSGDIRSYFTEIWKRNRRHVLDRNGIRQGLADKIRSYRKRGKKKYQVCEDRQEKAETLLSLIEIGMELHEEALISNFDLRTARALLGDESFLEEYGREEDMIDFSRQFMFSWGIDDEVAEEVVEMFNAGASDYCQATLVQVMPITSVKGKVEFSDYPLRWQDWYLEFLNCIQ